MKSSRILLLTDLTSLIGRTSLLFATLLASNAFAATAPLDFDAVNDAALAEPVGAKASAAAVLRAQILLQRAHFSVGEIDAGFGSNTRKAIAAYQGRSGLTASGVMDAASWAALNLDTQPVLTRYTVSAADVGGPFVALPKDMMEKAALPALGYESALEALAEKFHSSPKLLALLNPGVDLSQAEQEIIVPALEGMTKLEQVAKAVVDRSESTVTLLDASGQVLSHYPASTGSEHDPLPVGEWKILAIAPNPTFHYNPDLFWDANPMHAKAKIPAGPNNPVGVVWVDLSKEHYGIHGTPEPSRVGKSQSHGCIRLTNWDAKAFSEAVIAGAAAGISNWSYDDASIATTAACFFLWNALWRGRAIFIN